MHTLDVRPMPPKDRHAAIFGALDGEDAVDGGGWRVTCTRIDAG